MQWKRSFESLPRTPWNAFLERFFRSCSSVELHLYGTKVAKWTVEWDTERRNFLYTGISSVFTQRFYQLLTTLIFLECNSHSSGSRLVKLVMCYMWFLYVSPVQSFSRASELVFLGGQVGRWWGEDFKATRPCKSLITRYRVGKGLIFFLLFDCKL